MIILNAILAIVIVLFVISGAFALIGAVLGVTFGILGTVMGAVWSVLFSPVPIIVFLIWLIFRRSRVRSK